MLERAFNTFKRTDDRPTLVIIDSHIAYGSPHKQDTSAAHGEPLGEDEIRLTKRNYGWPEEAKFLAPEEVREDFRQRIGQRSKALRDAWFAKFEEYKIQYPEEGAGDFTADDYSGRNFHSGVREHAMGAIINGMSLVKVRPYGSGFLIFSDYARPAIRLSALMEIPVIHIFTTNTQFSIFNSSSMKGTQKKWN
jgi:transketolase